MMHLQQHLQQQGLHTRSTYITTATTAAVDSANMSSCSCSTCQLAAVLQDSTAAAVAALHKRGTQRRYDQLQLTLHQRHHSTAAAAAAAGLA
jgi:hypothetical protein